MYLFNVKICSFYAQRLVLCVLLKTTILHSIVVCKAYKLSIDLLKKKSKTYLEKRNWRRKKKSVHWILSYIVHFYRLVHLLFSQWFPSFHIDVSLYHFHIALYIFFFLKFICTSNTWKGNPKIKHNYIYIQIFISTDAYRISTEKHGIWL